MDNLLPVNVNFTHTSPNMAIEITTSYFLSIFSTTFGIRELFILIDYVKFI